MIPLDDALVRSPIVHVLNSSEGRNSDLEKKSMDNIGEGQITPGGGGLYFSPHYPQKRRFHLPIEIGRILAGFLKNGSGKRMCQGIHHKYFHLIQKPTGGNTKKRRLANEQEKNF